MWTDSPRSSSTYTDISRTTATNEEYHLLIGGGYKLEIGGGYFLIIQPGSEGWTDVPKS